MITLDAGNVLLKPAMRKQFMASLRRTMSIGSRFGKFLCTITLRRVGRCHEIRADLQDGRGPATFRVRQASLRHAWHDLVRQLAHRVHDDRLLLRRAVA